jgi:hypothetical protein
MTEHLFIFHCVMEQLKYGENAMVYHTAYKGRIIQRR